MSHFPLHRKVFCSMNISCPLVWQRSHGDLTQLRGAPHTFSLLIQGKTSQADSGKSPLRLLVALSCELFKSQRAAAIQELGHIWKILFPCWEPAGKPQWVPEQPGTHHANAPGKFCFKQLHSQKGGWDVGRTIKAAVYSWMQILPSSTGHQEEEGFDFRD